MELRSSRSRSRTPFVQLTRLEEQNMANVVTEQTIVRRTTRNKTYVDSNSSFSDDVFETEEKRRSLRNRCKTSDYSSEEDYAEQRENGVKSALQVYKEAGEYWNKFPKTDYTYSSSSKDRVELAPGVVNMPNMSRKSLRRSMEPSSITSTTQISNNYNHRSSNNHVKRSLNYSQTIETIEKTTVITRIYRSLITLLLITYSSMENMFMWIASTYYKTASRLFLFDTWLMQKSNARKYAALGALILLPLLLLAGWGLLNQSNEPLPLPVNVDLKTIVRHVFASAEYRQQTDLINELKSELNRLKYQQVLYQTELNKCCNKRVFVYEKSGGVGEVSDAQIRKIVHESLAIYDADKTGLVDYALESSGGQIISTRCTENYHSRTAVLSVLGVPLWYPSNTPRVIITPGVTPGECWAFSNFPGFVVIQLSAFVKISAVSVEHIPERLAPGGVRDSAPRLFTVWGLMHENDRNPLNLGKFEYKLTGPALQYFPVDGVETPVNMVELRVESNHGNMNYTCLYRFRVHGNQT